MKEDKKEVFCCPWAKKQQITWHFFVRPLSSYYQGETILDSFSTDVAFSLSLFLSGEKSFVREFFFVLFCLFLPGFRALSDLLRHWDSKCTTVRGVHSGVQEEHGEFYDCHYFCWWTNFSADGHFLISQIYLLRENDVNILSNIGNKNEALYNFTCQPNLVSLLIVKNRFTYQDEDLLVRLTDNSKRALSQLNSGLLHCHGQKKPEPVRPNKCQQPFLGGLRTRGKKIGAFSSQLFYFLFFIRCSEKRKKSLLEKNFCSVARFWPFFSSVQSIRPPFFPFSVGCPKRRLGRWKGLSEWTHKSLLIFSSFLLVDGIEMMSQQEGRHCH